MTRERALRGLAAAYFAVAAVGVRLPASAEAVLHGRVWLLATSGLAAQTPYPVLQVAVTAAVAALVIARAGAATWWRAALAGHVGSALIVYGSIAAAGADPTDPDWGVSCVLGASFGALLALPGRRWIGLAGALALLPISYGWLGLEHPLSVALGYAVTAWAAAGSPRPSRRAGRPWARPRDPRRRSSAAPSPGRTWR
jgi:hypothetical protein